MIIPGRTLLRTLTPSGKPLLRHMLNPTLQVQPCGIDLTLSRVLRWTSPGTVDFSNRKRQPARTEAMDWRHERDCSSRVSDTQRKGGQHQQQNAKQEHLKEDGKGHDNVGTGEGGPEALYLPLDMGSYLIEFNEHVSIPLDAMGQLFVRSSLWRAGVWFGAGVVDSGYEGILGGLLTVVNPSGVVIYKNARIAQVVMTKLTEKIGEDDGYGGVYQGRNKL